MTSTAGATPQGKTEKVDNVWHAFDAGAAWQNLALQAARPNLTQVVPMDGYHLANSTLAALGRSQRKGAPDTFDAAGFALSREQPAPQERDEIKP